MDATLSMRSARRTSGSVAAGVCGIVLLTPASGSVAAQGASRTLPAAFERYLAAEVHPTAAERRTLLSGGPLTKLLPSDPGKEVFVFGAIWINATRAQYVRRVQDIEEFERGGGFRITRKISNPARIEDFAHLELSENDRRDLRRCRPGDCDLKLSARGLEVFRTQVRWGTPTEKSDADTALRRLALEYVNGYREGGNARLAVYRDADHPVFVADEFRSMIERVPSLARLPDLLTYLLEYPAASLPDSTDFLYWQVAQFGLKPTTRLNHLVIQERPGQTIIASKMLYASHYFWTALEQRILQPDPERGPGFWLVTINRSRSDGLRGFVGRLLRGRVRSEAQKGTETTLRVTKAKLEAR